ncbi:MAG: dipeptidase [Chloroflexi bacterium]|nr:dipeptidase [Chloroflexota bacterium]
MENDAENDAARNSIDPEIEAYLDRTREARHASYLEFLRIPSISSLPEHAPDVRRAARWIAAELTRIGFEGVEVAETAGHPVVYADWLHAPGAPTVLVYCHYDVQPVDPIEAWETAPFDPFIRDGRVVGRGAADDKGQLHLHLQAAEALFATRGRLPLNVRILFEGEEEITSISLAPWLEANRERLAADAVIISDTGFFEGNLPALTVALRGNLYTQIDVTGSPVDLHSGGFGGGVENPANALAGIISQLKDRDGRVTIPGFYDEVIEPTRQERFEISCLPFDEDAFRAEIGVRALSPERGWTALECRAVRPTLDVNGLWGGFQGDGQKTIIPASAHAKVSCRLVPNQAPDRVFERFRDHVLRIAPPGVTVEVRNLGTALPVRTDTTHPIAQAALAALRAEFGREPLLIRAGGTIGVASMFVSQLGLPLVMLGFTNPDDNAHAPNEFMLLENYERGLRTICRLWDDLGAKSGDRAHDMATAGEAGTAARG